jgi:hypothetical protein
MSIIVYGPQGCGKTLHAIDIMKYFGMSSWQDEWRPGMKIPENTLLLTNVPCENAIRFSELSWISEEKSR